MMNHLLAVALGAMLLIGGGDLALAQSSAKTDTKTDAKTGNTTGKTRAPARKPAAVATATSGEPGRLSDYWTIERALPDRSRSGPERKATPEAVTPLSRVPMQNTPGTIGLESRDIRATTFADGRPVPGLNQNAYNDSSYVGMSFNVQSHNNGFPLPIPPSPRAGGSSGW